MAMVSLRFGCVVALLVAPFVFAGTPFAKGPGGHGSLQARGLGGAPNMLCTPTAGRSKYVSQICIDNVFATWKAWTLMGEPVVDFKVRWTLAGNPDQYVVSTLRGTGTDDVFYNLIVRDIRDQTVLEALKRLHLADLHLAATLVIDEPAQSEYESPEAYARALDAFQNKVSVYARSLQYHLPVEAGAIGPPGGTSYNTPGSPEWNDVFSFGFGGCEDGHVRPPSVDGEEARAIFTTGFRLVSLQVCGFTVAGLGDLDRALEKTCLAWRPYSPAHNKCSLKCDPGTQPNADHTFCIKPEPKKVAEQEDAKGKDGKDDTDGRDGAAPTAEEEAARNEALESQLSSATRILQFESESSQNGGRIQGEIQDAVSGQTLGGVLIEVLKDGQVVSSQRAGGDGAYDIPLLNGTYDVRFAKDGYLPITARVTVRRNETTSVVRLRQIPQQYAGTGTAAGVIKDAFNGSVVAGVAVTVIGGVNHRQGDVVASAVTGADGAYSIELPAGNYTLVGRKEGYAAVSGPIVVVGRTRRDGQNFAIAPRLQAGRIRIVLSWDSSPSDLDSHLRTPSGAHVSYRNRRGGGAGLDTDDTNGHGPETITVYDMLDGRYEYWVHKYSSDGSLRSSGARVDVYGAYGLARTFNVPRLSGGSRDWQVFGFDRNAGWLTDRPANYIDDDPPPAAPQAAPQGAAPAPQAAAPAPSAAPSTPGQLLNAFEKELFSQ
ncbi:MAG: carboxypeptidase regulatory-like domain-containing protein [Hyphomicrobiales bacterium]|nr:carboxypeptidase regulatory-like domain-containing protein [Hyphomicrobiales bacterium]MCP5372802.1 carboxypeptidase regulatory-like domain-containing protein [Hyphomicrobiales bacterium]